MFCKRLARYNDDGIAYNVEDNNGDDDDNDDDT